MSKILVTGATGFIGRHLVPELLNAGHEVCCAVSQKVDWIKADQVQVDKLEVQNDWSKALHQVDIVIHMAARVHIMQKDSKNSLNEYYQINSKATKNLAEQAAKNQVKRFIFISSIKVNGEFTLPCSPLTEKSRVKPEDPYSESKLQAERYLQAIAQNTDMEIVILRPTLVYGPGVSANFLRLLKLAGKNCPLPFGSVHNKRNFLYIDNLVSAITAVLTAPKAANQTYLIADDEPLSLKNMLKLIGNGMNIKVRFINIPVSLLLFVFKVLGLKELNTRLFKSLEVSNAKIKSELSWTPPVSAVDGLIKTAKWYKYDSNS